LDPWATATETESMSRNQRNQKTGNRNGSARTQESGHGGGPARRGRFPEGLIHYVPWLYGFKMSLRDVKQGWTTGFFRVPSLPRRMGSCWIVLAVGLIQRDVHRRQLYIHVHRVHQSPMLVFTRECPQRSSSPVWF
jgi:hypothetical protein